MQGFVIFSYLFFLSIKAILYEEVRMKIWHSLVLMSLISLVVVMFWAAGTLFVGCGLDQLDHGAALGRNGEVLHPRIPLLVFASETSQIEDVKQWWEDQLRHDLFVEDCSDLCERVEVVFDYLEPGLLGTAGMEYDESGLIHFCSITLESSLVHDEELLEHILRHEIGHCLGLADDEISLDLDSIMSPDAYGGRVTPKDRMLIGVFL